MRRELVDKIIQLNKGDKAQGGNLNGAEITHIVEDEVAFIKPSIVQNFETKQCVDDFIRDLKFIRLKLKINIRDITKVLKCDNSLLGLWEKKRSKPKKLLLLKLADLYKIELTDVEEKYNLGANSCYNRTLKENNVVGTVKTTKNISGGVKRVFTRKIENQPQTSTNGEAVKRIYKKREAKTKPAVEDA